MHWKDLLPISTKNKIERIHVQKAKFKSYEFNVLYVFWVIWFISTTQKMPSEENCFIIYIAETNLNLTFDQETFS